MPYRTPPPKPARLTALDLLIAIDAISGSLRIKGSGMFRYTEEVREKLRCDLLSILNDTQYNVEMVDEQKQPSEA
jgi:hypothetical protein